MEADLRSRRQRILDLVARVEQILLRLWPITGRGWRPRCRRSWSARPWMKAGFSRRRQFC